ncbi:uncharacterized protein LOC134210454 [Armigeres subalbatus]|uniref:uncharacterized protein LOC134210454 n=1 Tax=Armigeres subalbatus TaxID=124917 RepID=UPI002ECFB567
MNFHRPKICRICRAPDNDDLISVRLIQDSISIARMVEVLTDIQVTLDKNLPQNICLQCLERVRSAYQLRLQCIESDKQFRNEIYSVKDVLKLSHDESKDMIKLEIEALDKDIEQEDEIFTTDPDEHSLSIVPEESNEKIDLKIIAEETEESFLVEESIVETEDSKLTAAQQLIDILAPEEDNNRKSSLMYLSHYQEKDYEVLIESDHYDHVRFMSASCCGCSERFKDKTDLVQHGLIEHRRPTKVMSKPKNRQI